MIIDSHVHFGKSAWGDFSPEYLMNLIDSSVDIAICSNLEGIESPNFLGEFDCNMAMINIAKKYTKLKPLFVCQPNLSENENIAKNFLERYPGVVGLKFHPECMKLPANNEKYDKYLKLAQEFKKPCLFHSGHIKSRFSSPKLIYQKAQEFPELPIILGHLSTGPRHSHIEAIELLLDSIENNKATLYVDVSWIDFAFERLNGTYEDTLLLIEALKNTPKGDFTHRILWGSDCPVGEFNHSQEAYARNLNVFKQRVLEKFGDEILLENLLENNAKRLYSL